MNFGIVFIGFSIVALPRVVKSSEVISDVLSAVFHHPNATTNDRQLEILKALDDDYVVMDTVGLVKQYGYPVEEHTVRTEDGYNIKIFRIPGSPTVPPMEGKPMVFIQHGIICSSDSWTLFGPGYDLAFLLADDGYDVWLGNVRGNSYGRSHTNLTTDDKEFWNYSFHEIGMWDLPAMINHALEQGGQTNLTYVGHSMGTTAVYVLLSEKPEYNDKIRLVVSLAPIALWNEKPNIVYQIIVLYANFWKIVFNLIGIYDLFPQMKPDVVMSRNSCSDGSITQFLCILMLYIFAGKDTIESNINLSPYIELYAPAGISMQTPYHYQQNIESGIFRQFDHGKSNNMKIYGTKEPPTYDLSKISAPNVLIYGQTDAISKAKNAVELAEQLPNLVALEVVPFDSFNHLDFMWATHAKYLLYDRVIDLISMYSK